MMCRSLFKMVTSDEDIKLLLRIKCHITTLVHYAQLGPNTNVTMPLDKIFNRYFINLVSYKCCYFVNLAICILTIVGLQLHFGNIAPNIMLKCDENDMLPKRELPIVRDGDGLAKDVLSNVSFTAQTGTQIEQVGASSEKYKSAYMDQFFSHSDHIEHVSGNDSYKHDMIASSSIHKAVYIGQFFNNTDHAEIVSGNNGNIHHLAASSNINKAANADHDVPSSNNTNKAANIDQFFNHNDLSEHVSHTTSYKDDTSANNNSNKTTSGLTVNNQLGTFQTPNHPIHRNTKHIVSSTTRTILFWDEYSSSASGRITCPKCTCRTIGDLSQLAKADAVIFSVFFLPNGTVPRHAHSGQVFVFLDYESQGRTYYLRKRHSSPFAFLNNYYNVTMTFKDHPDTDIHVPYGSYTDIHPYITSQLPSMTQVNDKTQYVAWIVSNCNAPSSRMLYYKELSKYISVDIYGKCGQRTCGDGCETQISRDYRFYLAFENSFCEGYATEKVIIYSICIPRTKYVRGILWFSRLSAASASAAASADTSSFSR